MCPNTSPDARSRGSQTLADVDEGMLIGILTSEYWRAGQRGVLLGIGDDAAVVAQPSGSVVATTDTMVREVDWRDDWSTAREVGAKAVVQNVADVAAMGASPTGLLVTLAAHEGTPLDWALELARGIGDTAAQVGAPVVGGDLSAAPPGVVMVTITALGDLEGRRPVRRAGAQPGDVVAVGGSLGWSGAGLSLYLRGDCSGPVGDRRRWSAEEQARDVVRWYHRTPSVSAPSGPRAAVAGATSMIDVSDGLSRDALRIAQASGVVVELDREALVRDFVVEPVLLAVGEQEGLLQVLHGGEEHSLLATFPPGTAMTFDDACTWSVVGRVRACEPQEDPRVLLDGEPLPVLGWDHFAG